MCSHTQKGTKHLQLHRINMYMSLEHCAGHCMIIGNRRFSTWLFTPFVKMSAIMSEVLQYSTLRRLCFTSVRRCSPLIEIWRLLQDGDSALSWLRAAVLSVNTVGTIGSPISSQSRPTQAAFSFDEHMAMSSASAELFATMPFCLTESQPMACKALLLG